MRCWLVLCALWCVGCTATPAPEEPALDLGAPELSPGDLSTDLLAPDLPAADVPVCLCQAGPCCDGCDFLPAETVCAQEVARERACDAEGGVCGQDVVERVQRQHCSGASAACEGALVWGERAVADDCTPDQGCAEGACVADEGCAQRCQGDGDCLPEQHCAEDGACRRDLCLQGAPYCEGAQRRRCDARGAGFEVMEDCPAQCTPDACVDCASNVCQDGGHRAGSFCDGERVQCSYEGACAVESSREQCADPTPICDAGRCVGCLRDRDCPSQLQLCQSQSCQCVGACSLGSQGCNNFFQRWTCEADPWGCERRVVIPCAPGQVCAGGACVCADNACAQAGVTEGDLCDNARRVRCGQSEGCAVEILSQDCPCACVEGACEPCDAPGVGRVVLGTGDGRFEPVVDGQRLNLYAGFQGGHHVFGSLRAYEISSPSRVSLEFYVLEGARRLTTWSTVVNLEPIEGGYEWVGVTVMFPLGTDPVSLDGRAVTLVLDARTADNRLLTDTRDVILTWPPR
jgi:hypothetical protein